MGQIVVALKIDRNKLFPLSLSFKNDSRCHLRIKTLAC